MSYRIRSAGRIARVSIGLLALGVLLQPVSAQADRSERVRGLNNELLRLHGEARENPPGQSESHKMEAAQVIKQRGSALRDLIQQNPGEALSLVFSPETLAELSEVFPESASELESYGSWQGLVERWVADATDGTWSRTLTRMNLFEESLDLYFADSEPRGLITGSLLRAAGIQVGGTAMVTESSVPEPVAGTTEMAALTSSNLTSGLMSAAASAPAAPICSTTGVQNTAVLLVTFPDVPPPAAVTTTGAYDVFFGSSGHSLDGYWRESSYGKMSAAGNVFGWYTLNQAYACTNTSTLANAAIAAASGDVNFQNYSRVFVVLPYDLGCGWSGMAMMACSTLNSPTGPFTASITYLTPNEFANRDRAVELVTHEAGHNLGLQHANWRDFAPEALGPVGVSGNNGEYGDVFSTMGFWNLGHYSASHKAQLNWLAPTTNYQVVQSSGTWSLQPLETTTTGLQALKVQRGTGNNAWLWIEYRQPNGDYDSTLAYTQPFSGALIHYEDPITGATTQLLDFTPDGSWDTWRAPALTTGNTWVDPYSNLSITVQSATSNALTVAVNYAGAVCTHANPTVSASPLNPSALAGGSVTYNVAVTNNDSAGCSTGSFVLSSTQPTGWLTTFPATWLAVAPGQSSTVTMTKNVPASVLPGTYPVDAKVVSGTFTGTGLANVTVTAPPPSCTRANPTVSASPVNPSTLAGGSVGYSVTVTNNDSAGCSAGTFSLTSSKPTGWVSTFSATSLTLSPGQSGAVTLTKKAPASVVAGVYAVDTTAAAGTMAGVGLANVTVTAPPPGTAPPSVTVTVSTPSLTYAVRGTVPVTATVLSGTIPAAGASVKFTMTEPGGGTSTKTVTADSTGVAVWSYKIGGKGPLGAYSVTTSASYGSQTATSNTASFTVVK